MDVFDLKDLLKEHADSDERSLWFMFRDALSMSLYIMPAGAEDLQPPHTEDEVYYVLSGKATWVGWRRDSPRERGGEHLRG